MNSIVKWIGSIVGVYIAFNLVFVTLPIFNGFCFEESFGFNFIILLDIKLIVFIPIDTNRQNFLDITIIIEGKFGKLS